jgi:hypothetical protein
MTTTTAEEAPQTEAPPAPLVPSEPRPLLADDEDYYVASEPPKDLPEHFVAHRDGKTFILFGGLVHLLHLQSAGRFKITTTLLQSPTKDNDQTTVMYAEVFILDKEGAVIRSTTGIGDANPSNVTRMVAQHAIRMAETRAIARALRTMTNVALTSLEETGGSGRPARQAQEPRQGATTNGKWQGKPPQGQGQAQAQAQGRSPQGQSAPAKGHAAPPPGRQQGKGPAPAAPAAPKRPPGKEGEDYVQIGTQYFTREQVLTKYHQWIDKLIEAGFEVNETLPDDHQVLEEIVAHSTALRGTYEQEVGGGA